MKKTKIEATDHSRDKLIASLLKIPHGKLEQYIDPGLAAAEKEPELLGHFLAYNRFNGKVRDSKVAFPVLAMRYLTRADQDLAENAVAHLLLLPARDLIRAYDFNKLLVEMKHFTPNAFHNLLRKSIKELLKRMEQNWRKWDRVAVQHRSALKSLYKVSHTAPSARAEDLLFKRNYVLYPGSLLSIVHGLKDMTAKEAAGAVLAHKIPLEVAIGSATKATDPDFVFALLENMTGNQVVTMSKFLKRLGVEKIPALKGAYEKAM